jgi:hypothetical protein
MRTEQGEVGSRIKTMSRERLSRMSHLNTVIMVTSMSRARVSRVSQLNTVIMVTSMSKVSRLSKGWRTR